MGEQRPRRTSEPRTSDGGVARAAGDALADGVALDVLPATPGARDFLVTIHYREPEFERRRGSVADPFRWTYRVAAHDADAAAAAGLRDFRATARASSVAWRRDVISVTAHAADEPDPIAGR